MKETLFESAPFVTLPILVVFATEINDVLAWNIRWATRWREHLTLHRSFDFPCDLYEKLLPNAARLRMFIGGFQKIFASLAINPFSYRLDQTQISFSCSNITNNLINASIETNKSFIQPAPVR